MPQHVSVNRERQLSRFTGPLDHATDTHASEGLAALCRENSTQHCQSILTCSRSVGASLKRSGWREIISVPMSRF